MSIAKRIANFHYASDEDLKTRKIGRTEYVFGIATAYNAFGLIGPEHNGLFVIDETNKRVLTDRVGPTQQSGYYGPNAEQMLFLAHVEAMSDEAFIDMVCKSERYRL